MGDTRFPRVLDVGCATGVYLKWAFDHDQDVAPVSLKRVRQIPLTYAGAVATRS